MNAIQRYSLFYDEPVRLFIGDFYFSAFGITYDTNEAQDIIRVSY